MFKFQISEGFKDYDNLREYSITNNQFRRGLMTSRIGLTNAEAEVVCSQFADPKRSGRTLWKAFCDEIDQGSGSFSESTATVCAFMVGCFCSIHTSGSQHGKDASQLPSCARVFQDAAQRRHGLDLSHCGSSAHGKQLHRPLQGLHQRQKTPSQTHFWEVWQVRATLELMCVLSLVCDANLSGWTTDTWPDISSNNVWPCWIWLQLKKRWGPLKLSFRTTKDSTTSGYNHFIFCFFYSPNSL